MNPTPLFRLSLLSLGLAVSALAQDTTTPPPSAPPAADSTPPPPTPPNPETSPADGSPPAGGHRHMRGYVLSDLTEKLTLTADQQTKVAAILKSDHEQMKDIRGDDSLSQEDKHAKFKELMAATKSQIRAVLTPEQQAIFDALPTHGERQKSPNTN